jgi:phosphopantetheinyl transferase
MPLVYQQNINLTTRLGVWHISEQEFFFASIPLQREITHPHKRLQHLAGRHLLRELYPDFPYSLIRIADTRKPFLENEAYHFSISHCGDYAAAMVSTDSRVGVDIEQVTARVEKIKHKFLSAVEQQMLLQLADKYPPGFYTQLLTTAWSIKESLFKWYGDGELDFKEHIHIDTIVFKESNEGMAHCRLDKDNLFLLQAHFLFFGSNCISWVAGQGK